MSENNPRIDETPLNRVQVPCRSNKPRKAKTEHFDELWMENRRRYRKALKGTRLTKDPVTGYMEPVGRDGFTAEDRRIFIERLKVCSNYKQIARSIPIDIQTFYDAIVVDSKFREDVNAANKLPNRSMQLNNAIKAFKEEHKVAFIADLLSKAQKYK